MKVRKSFCSFLFFAFFLICSSFLSSNSYAKIFPVLEAGKGVLSDSGSCTTANAGSFRAAICQGRDGGGNYVDNVCDGRNASNTVSFGIYKVSFFPAHILLAAPIVIPGDCQAKKITLDGTDCTGGTYNADGSCQTPNLDTREIVIDGRNIPAGHCAFEIDTTIPITIKNFTFVNLRSGAGAICVNQDSASVTLDNNHIGVRRMAALEAGHPLAGDPLVATPVGNTNGIIVKPGVVSGNLVIKNNVIANNTADGIQLQGSRTKVYTNTIQNNTGSGVSIVGAAVLNEIGDGADANKNTITANKKGGIVATSLVAPGGSQNHFHNNSIFQNIGLGIDLVKVGVLNLDGPTLFKDNDVTPNSSIHLAEDVIITPDLNNPGQFTLSANPHVAGGTQFTAEIYEVDPVDATDAQQRRTAYGKIDDDRSYGEGKILVASNLVTVDGTTGRFATRFTGINGKPYSVTLTDVNVNTSEFSAVVTTPPTGDDSPVCEGNDNNNGTGIKAPKAPTGLTATRDNADGSVTLSFTDNSQAPAEEDGFRVERAPGVADCSKAVYAPIAGSPIAKHVGTGNVKYKDITAPSGALCYRVTAYRVIPKSDQHDLKTCDSGVIVKDAPKQDGGNPDQPPVIIIKETPVPPKDPIIVIITDRTTKEDAFCVERADKPCQLAQEGDFKPIGEVVSPDKPGTGGTIPFPDTTAEPGHIYCYRAKAKIAGNCDPAYTSNRADAAKRNEDGSVPTPDQYVLEGSGGCSISESVVKFNFLSLIALLAITPVVFVRAFRFKKV